MPDRLGTVLDDLYRLDRLLGTGGVGSVYAATHLLLGQVRAVKLLHPEFAALGESVQRFQREARLLSGLDDPAFVKVHDFRRTAKGAYYLVMDLVEGESLLQRLAARKAGLPPGEVAAFFEPLCLALHKAHGQGLLHRDLKPDNLMLLPGGGIKILDFGTAKLLSDQQVLTQERTVPGTPYYLAPERALGRANVDARSDLFALGAILYEALSGRMAFYADTPHGAMMRVVREPIPPLHLADAALSERLDEVIATACAKDPRRRPDSALALWAALDAALHGASAPVAHKEEGEARGLLKAVFFPAAVDFVRTRYGAAGLERMAVALGREKLEALATALPTSWMAMAVAHELHEVVGRLFDDGSLEVMREMGRHFADTALRTVYRGFAFPGDPERLLQRAPLLFRALIQRGELTVARQEGHALARLAGEVDPGPALWATLAGFLQRCLELAGAREVRTQEGLSAEGAELRIWFAPP